MAIRHWQLRHRGRRRTLSLIIGLVVTFDVAASLFGIQSQASAESILRRRRSEDEDPHQNQVQMGDDTLIDRSGLSDTIDSLTDHYQDSHILASANRRQRNRGIMGAIGDIASTIGRGLSNLMHMGSRVVSNFLPSQWRPILNSRPISSAPRPPPSNSFESSFSSTPFESEPERLPPPSSQDSNRRPKAKPFPASAPVRPPPQRPPPSRPLPSPPQPRPPTTFTKPFPSAPSSFSENFSQSSSFSSNPVTFGNPAPPRQPSNNVVFSPVPVSKPSSSGGFMSNNLIPPSTSFSTSSSSSSSLSGSFGSSSSPTSFNPPPPPQQSFLAGVPPPPPPPAGSDSFSPFRPRPTPPPASSTTFFTGTPSGFSNPFLTSPQTTPPPLFGNSISHVAFTPDDFGNSISQPAFAPEDADVPVFVEGQAPPDDTRGDVVTTVLNGPLNDGVLHYGDLAKLKSNLRNKNKNVLQLEATDSSFHNK